jgi:Glycosyltransferase Family 4
MLTSLGKDGAECQLSALADLMAAQGHEVVLIVLKPREAHEWPVSIEAIRLGLRRLLVSSCSGLAAADRFLRSFHPDLVHSHSFSAMGWPT